MKTFVTHKMEISLIMSEEEAQWLNGVMQNPIYGDSPEHEPEEDAAMRLKFFDATKAAQTKL